MPNEIPSTVERSSSGASSPHCITYKRATNPPSWRGGGMTATRVSEPPAERRDGVSIPRLLWVAPLTVIVALIVNLIIKTLVQTLDPSLTEMPQLGRSLIILTLEGAI